jgi:hypothetical protein
MISPETIIEFQQAIKTEYDRDISFKEASEILFDLVAYFDMLQQMEAGLPRAP